MGRRPKTVERFPSGQALEGFAPIRAGDLSDRALVPRRLDLLTQEVRDGFEMVRGKLELAVDRLTQIANDHEHRIKTLERDVTALKKHLPKATAKRRLKKG